MSLPTTTLTNVPMQGPVVDKNGNITQQWRLFFEFLYTRVGGLSAPSIATIANSAAFQGSLASNNSFSDANDEGEGFVIPGPQGVPGDQGISGPPLFFAEFDEGDFAIPFGPSPTSAIDLGTLLTFNNITGNALAMTITPFAATAGQTPGALALVGNASQDATTAGAVTLTGGAALTPSTGAGGNVAINGGAATSANGGAVSARGGNGTIGGGFTLTGGTGSAGAGGSFTMGSGTGTTTSGNVTIATAAGGSTSNSGRQSFSTGNTSLAAGTTGNISFTTGNASGAGGVAGNITLTGGTANTTGTGGSIIAKPGAGATTRGAINFQNTLGTSALKITDDGTNTLIGLFNVTPVAQQATAPTAVDLATVITLANTLKAAMTNLGLTN